MTVDGLISRQHDGLNGSPVGSMKGEGVTSGQHDRGRAHQWAA